MQMAAESTVDERIATFRGAEGVAGTIHAVVTIAVLLARGCSPMRRSVAAVEIGIPAAHSSRRQSAPVVAFRARRVVPSGSLTAATTLIVAGGRSPNSPPIRPCAFCQPRA